MLTDTLRLGPTNDRKLAARWRRAPQDGLTSLIGYEGGAVWLYRRLKAHDALDSVRPDLHEALRKQAIEDAAFRLDVEVEATEVLALLHAAMIPVFLVKGLARSALAQRWAYIDARSTADVDLLLPLDRLAEADKVLRDDGYKPAVADDKVIDGHHHLPPLHKGRITVELHSSMSHRLPAAEAWSRALNGAQAMSWCGRAVRVPSATELAWNAVSHAMEDEVQGFRLSRFLEVAALAANDAPVDWQLIRSRCDTPESGASGAVAMGWLAAAFELVEGSHHPAGFTSAPTNVCQLLQWRHSVLQWKSKVGPAVSEHLMEEGPRSIFRMPRRGSPADATRLGKMRRPVASSAGRVAFALWRATAPS